MIARWIGRRTPSVQAIAITPDQRVVMVRHSYMPGWHFPGGCLRRGEAPEAGIIRELREEIGLTRWGEIARIESYATAPGMFVFTEVEYCFRPSLEIDRVAEFAFDAPMRPGQRALIDRWRAQQATQARRVEGQRAGVSRAG
jgi:8-oxo-dGTP pyrophosphatase MutT (NUDIX family)